MWQKAISMEHSGLKKLRNIYKVCLKTFCYWLGFCELCWAKNFSTPCISNIRGYTMHNLGIMFLFLLFWEHLTRFTCFINSIKFVFRNAIVSFLKVFSQSQTPPLHHMPCCSQLLHFANIKLPNINCIP